MYILFDGNGTLYTVNNDYEKQYSSFKEFIGDVCGVDIDLDTIKITIESYIKYDHKHGNYLSTVIPFAFMRAANSFYIYEKNEKPPIDVLTKAYDIGNSIIYTNPTVNKILLDIIDNMKNKHTVELATIGDLIMESYYVYCNKLNTHFNDIYILESDECIYDMYDRLRLKHDKIPIFITTNYDRALNAADSMFYSIYIGDRTKYTKDKDRLYIIQDLTQLISVLSEIDKKFVAGDRHDSSCR